MTLRFIILALLVVDVIAQCKLCLNGGRPGNPKATIGEIGGFSCQYVYDNSGSLAANGQQCTVVQLPQNQALCGCSTAVPPTTSPVQRVEPPSAPTTTVSSQCKVCLSGGAPRNPSATISSLGGLTCQYFNTEYFHSQSLECQVLHKSANQALCGCNGVTPTSPVRQPTLRPTVRVTPRPTVKVTPRPTVRVTPRPTVRVTPRPTIKVTPRPTVRVTPRPTAQTIPAPVRVPTLRPVLAPTRGCRVCLNGGAPRNPSATVAALGGFTCQYFYYNSEYVSPSDSQCVVVQLPENQAVCGCP
jgi:hypothetical protein